MEHLSDVRGNSGALLASHAGTVPQRWACAGLSTHTAVLAPTQLAPRVLARRPHAATQHPKGNPIQIPPIRGFAGSDVLAEQRRALGGGEVLPHYR